MIAKRTVLCNTFFLLRTTRGLSKPVLSSWQLTLGVLVYELLFWTIVSVYALDNLPHIT